MKLYMDHLIESHEQPYEPHIIIPNLKMQKLRLIEVGKLAHRHTDDQWGSQHPCSESPHHAAYPDTIFSYM